jgi:hypothetical protein
MAISSIESTFPWMKGDRFKARVKSSKTSAMDVKAAIREQFLEDRKNHLKNLKLQQGATHCLNSTYPVSGCDNYNKALATTPELPRMRPEELSFDLDKDLYDDEGNEKELTPQQEYELNKRAQATFGNTYFDDAKCVEDMRGLRSDVNWQIGMAAGQIAITGLTLGAVALPGAVAVRAGGFVARAVNHSKVAWNIAKTGVGRGRLMLKGALLGSSALGEAYLMKGEVRDLVDSCDSHLPEPSSVTADEDYTPACPRAPKYNNGKIQSMKMSPSQTDWQDCALSSALMGLGLVPILGDMAGRRIKKLWKNAKVAKENANQIRMFQEGVADRLIDGTLDADDFKLLKSIHKDRLKDAKVVLGKKKLTEAEEMAILKAHYIGMGKIGKDGISLAGLENYTQGQITAKARTLFQAGFNRKQVEALMDTGITGSMLDVANRTARVERFLKLAEADPSISSKTIAAAKKRDLEMFDVVGGNLVMANKPGQIMIKANIEVGDVLPTPKTQRQPLRQVAAPQRQAVNSVKPRTNEVTEQVDTWRRALAMNKQEAGILNQIDKSTMQWVNNPRFKNKTLCARSKSKISVFRREQTLSELAKLKKPKNFRYHGKVPSSQVLDRHVSSSSANGYMGVATSMVKSVVGGNGGRHIAKLCVNPGVLVCIIGGAESELVLMDSKWSSCP